MKAIIISKAGGPEVLKIEDVESKEPGDNEIVIKVKAAGVNRSDILTRKNPDAYGSGLDKAIIPGLEVAGEIIKTGSKVATRKIGDRVCALIPAGGYAEYVTIHENLSLPIPGELNYVEAASLPETVFTVWFNVFQQAYLKKGEKLLIHGGTSGVGAMGLQMAKAMGIKTYTTVGSAKKISFLEDRELGTVINYKEQNFEEIFKDEKIDVILDMVGGDYTQKNLEILNNKGRLVYINGMNGITPKINLWTIMSKRLILTGSLLKPQSIEVKSKIAKEVEEQIWPLLSSKAIKPVVNKTFPLEEAGKAHSLMESSEHIGKIVLTIDS